MIDLSAEERRTAQSWAGVLSGCRCQMTVDESGRYVVARHDCPVCREWNQRMKDTGVSDTAKTRREPTRHNRNRKFR